MKLFQQSRAGKLAKQSRSGKQATFKQSKARQSMQVSNPVSKLGG